MKFKLLTLALLLPTLAFCQTVENRTETTCNDQEEDIYSILDAGRILFVNAAAADCPGCNAIAPEVDLFAAENQQIIRVWGALSRITGTSTCDDADAWEQEHGWNNIHFFIDPQKHWETTYQAEFIVINPENKEVYHSSFNFADAKAAALQLANELGLTSTRGPEDQQLRIVTYPNPFLESLNIEIKNVQSRNAIVTLSDMTGKVLLSTTMQAYARTLQINTGEIPSGTYFLEVRTEKTAQTFKIFK